MMRDQKILRIVTKLQIPFVLVFGFYVLTHGELGPGGGFQSGVILGAAFILYAMVYGVDARHRVLPRQATDAMAALGVLLYVGTGVACLLLGRAFLDYAAISPGAPADGESWGMTLVEYGVGITVTAVMVTIFNEVAEAGGTAPQAAGHDDDTHLVHRDRPADSGAGTAATPDSSTDKTA
ncbi:MAG: Na(+)/H(+) antiporter subunit B [Planctomycetota bacterium]